MTKPVKEGVAEAFDFWLSQHDVSTPECIVEGVQKAVAAWLDTKEDKLVAAIAEAIAQKHGDRLP